MLKSIDIFYDQLDRFKLHQILMDRIIIEILALLLLISFQTNV